MKKLTIAMLVMMVLSTVSFAVAQEAPAPADKAVAAAEAAPAPAKALQTLLIPFGTGLVVVGGAFGIARIGAGAVDAMARQPEYAGAIQTGMILSAALVEGATLFALVICLLGYIF